MIPYDKKLHFICCFVIAIALSPFVGFWSIAIAIAAGFAKEIYDWKDYGGFSWDDIVADFLGVVASIPIILIINNILS